MIFIMVDIVERASEMRQSDKESNDHWILPQAETISCCHNEQSQHVQTDFTSADQVRQDLNSRNIDLWTL